MDTIFKLHTIAGIIAYAVTNHMVNNNLHGWEGVLVGALVSGLVGALNVQRGEE